jgi:glutamyl-tRNA synthetase
LILRLEDLDPDRCRPEFTRALLEDLRWFGLSWAEGPDTGGTLGPYAQSQRLGLYEAAFQILQANGSVYPCSCSRRDVQRALEAPHAGEEEPIYPGTCRPDRKQINLPDAPNPRCHWRFRVPDGETVSFVDLAQGPQSLVAGRDFGDFIVWRQDGLPSYQLAAAVDDAGMGITEVVRGTDLLISTARQLLLYRALQRPAPEFFHCPLVTDASGIRLAKRHESLSLRALRAQGWSPQALRNRPDFLFSQ